MLPRPVRDEPEYRTAMERSGPLEYLTTVVGTVQGHLVVGRLATEGIAAVMRGTGDGPYPFPAEVDVLVPRDQVAAAREILMAVQVEEAFGGPDRVPRGRRRLPNALGLRRLRRRAGS